MSIRKISDKPLIDELEDGDALVLIKSDGSVRLVDPAIISQRVWSGDAETFVHLEEVDDDAYYFVTGDVFAAGLADVSNLAVTEVNIYASGGAHEVEPELPELEDEACESSEGFTYVSITIGTHRSSDGGSITTLADEAMTDTITITNIEMEVDE